MKKFFDEFKKFALRGNVMDMAVGVVVGGAFSKIVTSLVNDVIMPLVSLLTGAVHVSELFLPLTGDFTTPYNTVQAAKDAGVATLNYGAFLQTVLDFFLIALSIFLVIKAINKVHFKKAEAPAAPKPTCPFCLEEVKEGATRCGHCGSELPKKTA